MEGPKCKATVSLDISNMKDGDVAGFSAFNGHSGLLSVVKEGDAKRLVMSTNVVNFDNTPNKILFIESRSGKSALMAMIFRWILIIKLR